MKTRRQSYPSPNDNIAEKKKKGEETVKDVKNNAKTRNRRQSNITQIEVSDVKQNTVKNTRNRKKNQESVIESTPNKIETVRKRKIKKQITDEKNDDDDKSEKDITKKKQYSPKILRKLLEEDSYIIRGKQKKIDCSKINYDSFCNLSNSTNLRCSPDRKNDDNTEGIECMKDESNNSNKKNIKQNKQSKKVNNNLEENCAESAKDNEKSEKEKDTEDKTLTNKSENVELMKLENEPSFGNRKINIHGIIIEELNKFETDEEKSFIEDDNSCLDDDDKSEKGNILDAVHIDNDKPEQVFDKTHSFPSSEYTDIEEQRKQYNTNEINSENSSENENNNQKDTNNFMSCNNNQNDFVNESDKETDSDSSPDEVTFQNSQNRALSFLKDAEDQVRRIKLQTKESRRKYHERNLIQKEEKKKRILELKAKKLPQNVLDDLSKLEKKKQSNEYSEETFPKKIKFDEENEHSDVRVNQAQEELISIHGNTEFKVCKLNNFVKKPMTTAESAKEWKRNLLFGKRNKRESVKEMMSKKVKQSVAGKLLPIH